MKAQLDVTVLPVDSHRNDLAEALEYYGSSAYVHMLDGHYVIFAEPRALMISVRLSQMARCSRPRWTVVAAHPGIISFDEYCEALEKLK